jgi:hypothetical protein
MSAGQRQLLEQLIKLYADRHPKDVGERLVQEIRDAGLENVHFGWAVPAVPAQPQYYRIQGPRFVIEFCNTHSRGNHSHSVWRSSTGDFGLPAKGC